VESEGADKSRRGKRKSIHLDDDDGEQGDLLPTARPDKHARKAVCEATQPAQEAAEKLSPPMEKGHKGKRSVKRISKAERHHEAEVHMPSGAESSLEIRHKSQKTESDREVKGNPPNCSKYVQQDIEGAEGDDIPFVPKERAKATGAGKKAGRQKVVRDALGADPRDDSLPRPKAKAPAPKPKKRSWDLEVIWEESSAEECEQRPIQRAPKRAKISPPSQEPANDIKQAPRAGKKPNHKPAAGTSADIQTVGHRGDASSKPSKDPVASTEENVVKT
jgi:hypothetical protein